MNNLQTAVENASKSGSFFYQDVFESIFAMVCPPGVLKDKAKFLFAVSGVYFVDDGHNNDNMVEIDRIAMLRIACVSCERVIRVIKVSGR